MRLAVVGTVAVVTGSVAAAEPAEVEEVRYGGTIVLVDAIGVSIFTGTLVYTLREESDSRYWGIFPMMLGLGIYSGGGYFVHDHHDNKSGANTSLVVKIALPLVGVFGVASAIDCPEGETSCRRQTIGAIIGGAVSVLAATTLDAVFLARMEKPYVAPVQGGATFGVTGSF